MKFEINTTLKGIKDEPLQLTVKDVIIQSLLSPVNEDKQEEKWHKYEVYKKVKEALDEVELKTEDVTLIKKMIGRFQPPLILGQCYEIIEDNGNS